MANTFALDAEGTGSTQSARHRGMSSKNDSEVLKVVNRSNISVSSVSDYLTCLFLDQKLIFTDI